MNLTLAAVLLAAAAVAPHPKNVILLIADGTGPAHFTAAKHFRGEEFRIGTMPVVGLVTTPCADRYVTDSAAGATALATGFKTNYETLSLDPVTGASLPTVLEVAEKAGKVTGLVTTADFWDATPAAFAAHAKRRDDPDVMDQMVRRGVEIIAGTGLEKFGTEGRPSFDEFAAKAGYTAIDTRAELDAARGPRLLVSFAGPDRDLDVPDAPLPMLAQWALDRLSGNAKGFFLMIEHEGTDSSGHQTNAIDLRKALISFDQTVGVALDFAAKRTDTLVIVTADHETGGLRVSETKKARFRLEWSTTDHTATMVPLFAFGPGSAAFAGLQDNTDVGKKLMAAVR
ncbi:MAG: alkaline phosphatase [Acidobacteriota bacterium]